MTGWERGEEEGRGAEWGERDFDVLSHGCDGKRESRRVIGSRLGSNFFQAEGAD